MSDLVHDWKVSWTTDGDIWHERGFHTLETAQRLARGLVKENGHNSRFAIYAERMLTVNTASFLNAESAGAVELAPHMLGTADTFA